MHIEEPKRSRCAGCGGSISQRVKPWPSPPDVVVDYSGDGEPDEPGDLPAGPATIHGMRVALREKVIHACGTLA